MDVPAGIHDSLAKRVRESSVSAEVEILYTNYRGETSLRSIIPREIWFGKTEWHLGPQWFMDAYDIQRHAVRSFALKDIHRWETSEQRSHTAAPEASPAD